MLIPWCCAIFNIAFSKISPYQSCLKPSKTMGCQQHKPLFPTIIPTASTLSFDEMQHKTNRDELKLASRSPAWVPCHSLPPTCPCISSTCTPQWAGRVFVLFFSWVRVLHPPPLTTCMPPCTPLHPEVKASVPLQGNQHTPSQCYPPKCHPHAPPLKPHTHMTHEACGGW